MIINKEKYLIFIQYYFDVFYTNIKLFRKVRHLIIEFKMYLYVVIKIIKTRNDKQKNSKNLIIFHF